jgi:hypothetical protein
MDELVPGGAGPPGFRRITMNKRAIHDLARSIPPSYALIPLLPLTDTEIIVYFFNSLSRPAVTLRLYGRDWGPASIVETLNAHREIQPPYLRNTCSVKCNTAIKAGRNQFGGQWEDVNRAVFGLADDFKATDMISIKDGETTADYELLSLCVNLKKHPDPEVSGIFTECVKYCERTKAPYTLSNVGELAEDLIAGRTPKHPVPVGPSGFGRFESMESMKTLRPPQSTVLVRLIFRLPKRV